MIDGFATYEQRVRRNWQARPSWWSIEVVIPKDTPLYYKAKARFCSFRPLLFPDFCQPIHDWLAANISKPFRVKAFGVEFRNHSDAMLFFLALK
jgi:hypothetical protein